MRGREWSAGCGSRARDGGVRHAQRAIYSITLPGADDLPLHLNENHFFTEDETPVPVVRDLARYSADRLTDVLARRHCVEPEQVVLGAGATGILNQLLLRYVTRGSRVLIPDPSWDFYRARIASGGGSVLRLPLLREGRSFVYDTAALVRRISCAQPDVVLICSPNNPTGLGMPRREIAECARRFPATQFIVDETYVGFAAAEVTDERDCLRGNSNLHLVRSLSKFYGLAGARIGYLLSSDPDGLGFARDPFGCSPLSEQVALARLMDHTALARVRREVSRARSALQAELNAMPGLTAFHSQTNFVLVQTPSLHARAIAQRLAQRKVLIRALDPDGRDRFLRITVAPTAWIQRMASELRGVLQRFEAGSRVS